MNRQNNGNGRSGGRNQDATVFVGNMSYNASQDEIKRMFSGKGLNTVDVRLLIDEQG